jgi:hypothetical protein
MFFHLFLPIFFSGYFDPEKPLRRACQVGRGFYCFLSMGWLRNSFAEGKKLGKRGTRKNLPSDQNAFFCYNERTKTTFFEKTTP